MNALKHASAKNIFVNLIAKDSSVLLTVDDDGKGFDYEKTSASPDGGLGIGILQERLALVEGGLKVESHPGKGTQVIAEVPV
jgi:two-component system, NarL family, sensor kinase